MITVSVSQMSGYVKKQTDGPSRCYEIASPRQRPPRPQLGLNNSIPFEEDRKELQRGDKIILYTDGVPEFQNSKGNVYGEDRFYALLKKMQGNSIHKTLDAVIDALMEFGGQTKPKDDVSILGIEFKGRMVDWVNGGNNRIILNL